MVLSSSLRITSRVRRCNVGMHRPTEEIYQRNYNYKSIDRNQCIEAPFQGRLKHIAPALGESPSYSKVTKCTLLTLEEPIDLTCQLEVAPFSYSQFVDPSKPIYTNSAKLTITPSPPPSCPPQRSPAPCNAFSRELHKPQTQGQSLRSTPRKLSSPSAM